MLKSWPLQVKPPQGLHLNRAHPRLRGCVGWWPFIERGGTIITDLINGAVGTSQTTPTWTLGQRGSAFNFDGSTAYISIPNNPRYVPQNLSVSLWTKNNVSPAQYDGIIGKAYIDSWDFGWGMFYNSSSTVNFFIEHYANNVASSTISPTQWNHIVGTWDGTTISIYVNGVLGGTTDTYTGSLSDHNNIEIGRLMGNSYNINGQVDDLRIYNRGLSHNEVLSLYTHPWLEVQTPRYASFAVVAGGGSVTINPDPAIFTFSVPQPSLSYGAVIIAPDVTTLTFAAPQPNLSVGEYIIAVDPAVMTFSVGQPSVTGGSSITTPDVVVLSLQVPQPSVVPGEVTITPQPAVMDFSVPNPSLVVGEATVTPDSVVLDFLVPEPTILVTGTNSPDPIVLNFTVPNPSLTMGSVIVTPDSVVLTFTIPNPSISDGSDTLTGRLVFLRRRRRL